MQVDEEKFFLSILDSLHSRHDAMLTDTAAEYAVIIEAIIEGILNGAPGRESRDLERIREKMYRHARDFISTGQGINLRLQAEMSSAAAVVGV